MAKRRLNLVEVPGKHAHGRLIHTHGPEQPHPHRWVTLADPEAGIEAENPDGSYEEFMTLFGNGGRAEPG